MRHAAASGTGPPKMGGLNMRLISSKGDAVLRAEGHLGEARAEVDNKREAACQE
jgi:hypothetical protein